MTVSGVGKDATDVELDVKKQMKDKERRPCRKIGIKDEHRNRTKERGR